MGGLNISFDLAPFYAVAGVVIGALAGPWVVRKLVKLVNKS